MQVSLWIHIYVFELLFINSLLYISMYRLCIYVHTVELYFFYVDCLIEMDRLIYIYLYREIEMD